MEIGMELLAFHAIMDKFGAQQLKTVFVLKDSTGMVTHALLANLGKCGVLLQIAAHAHLDKTGMDSHALLVMVVDHGAAHLIVAPALLDKTGMELSVLLVPMDLTGMVIHVLLVPLVKFGALVLASVNAPLANNGTDQLVLLHAQLE